MGKRIIIVVSVVILLSLSLFLYVRYGYVYREGVNAGEINYFQREGWIFKTYEGKMIQTGYNSHNPKSSIQSNEFKFSVRKGVVADSLMRCTGKSVQIHWNYYMGTLPWRGNSNYIVDRIEYVGEGRGLNSVPVVE